MSAQCNTFAYFTIIFHRFSIRHHIQEEHWRCDHLQRASQRFTWHPFSVLFYLATVFRVHHNRRLVNGKICPQLLCFDRQLAPHRELKSVSVIKTIHGEEYRCTGFHLKCILLVSNFRQNRNLSTNFNTNPKYKIPRRSVLWRNKHNQRDIHFTLTYTLLRFKDSTYFGHYLLIFRRHYTNTDLVAVLCWNREWYTDIDVCCVVWYVQVYITYC
jgi:hypothetical protein